jgi:hypothetical protein
MESRRRHHPFKKLIRRIVNLIDERPADSSEQKHSQTSSAFRYLSLPSLAAMADQEEDLSSLPLPDRFSHKVLFSQHDPSRTSPLADLKTP